MRARIVEVREAHEKTFHWLFDPSVVSFSEWLGEESSKNQPIYWIQGKPGSGKSTLMKFAMRDRRMEELLASSGHPSWIFAAYFFHDRGSDVQKTLGGMLQELLYSILGQVPALLRFIIPQYLELVRSQRTRKPHWDSGTLENTLLSIVEQREHPLQLLLFLDALDEHHGDNDLLASFLKKFVSKADGNCIRLKLCLASRPWAVFKQHFGYCPSFAIHEHTRQDISTYIKARLEPDRQGAWEPIDQAGRRRVVDLVAEKALGVFIWVRLVVDLLSRGIRDGTPYSALEEQVNALPQELEELYADTLRRIEPEYTSEAYIMLQTVLCSLVQLPLHVLFAILDVNYITLNAAPDHNTLALEGHLRELSTRAAIRSSEETYLQRSRLMSRSGGLLEVVSISNPDAATEDESSALVVQFIHQTVKEFIQRPLQDIGLRGVSPHIAKENGFDFLVKSCANSADEWVSSIKKDVFVYARCAVKRSVETYGAHSSESWEAVEVVVNNLRASMLGNGNIELGWFLEQHKRLKDIAYPYRRRDYDRGYQRRGLDSGILRLAVAMGFPEYVAHRFKSAKQRPEQHPELLHIAVAACNFDTGIQDADHEYTIRCLVGLGYPVDRPIGMDFLDILLIEDLGVVGAMSPLAQVLVANITSDKVRLQLARTLLDLGANANDQIAYNTATDHVECNLLTFCVCHQSAALVRLLLQYGAGPKFLATDQYLLRCAYIRQDASVIEALLDAGFGPSNGIDVFNDPPSVRDALMVTGHIAAASVGGSLPTGALSLYKGDSDLQRFRPRNARSEPDRTIGAS